MTDNLNSPIGVPAAHVCRKATQSYPEALKRTFADPPLPVIVAIVPEARTLRLQDADAVDQPIEQPFH